MPGLAGIISRDRTADHSVELAVMLESMTHQPFYVSGACIARDASVYAGWVAHPGSFAQRQSRCLEADGIDIGFAGECVEETVSQRHHEHSDDSIAGLYRKYGDDLVERLNGVFSGFIFDRFARRMLIFNDRYGLERIYWHETEDATYFASEAKALLRILPQLRQFDEEGVVQYLAFGCTVEERTLFRGVQLLPGGSVWSFENGKCRKRRYFSPKTWEGQPALGPEKFESEFQETFERILPRYFESESKIGVSLTGGLDTRMIMACRPGSARDVVCYTFSGEKGLTLDDRLAARVAKSCGLEHHLLRIGSDFFSDFAAYADRTVYITDGSFGIVGAHETYLNAKARQLAPVRLTGNFGSEVLRGVSTFKPTGLSHDLLNPEFSCSVDASVKELSNFKEHPVTFAAFREIPWNLFGGVAAGRSQLTFRTPYLDNELVALAYRAPERLRKSSLPASRLVKARSAALSEIPTDRGFVSDNAGLEFLFRRFIAEATFKIDYYNSEGLPRLLSPLDPMLRRMSSNLGILGLHKYLPYSHWLRNELAPTVMERLSSRRVREAPWWAKNAPETLARAHISGRGNSLRELNAILTLEAIDRLFFSEISVEGSAHRQETIKVLA